MDSSSWSASRKRQTPDGGASLEPLAKVMRTVAASGLQEGEPANTHYEAPHAEDPPAVGSEDEGNRQAAEATAQAAPQMLPNHALAGSASGSAGNSRTQLHDAAAAAEHAVPQQDLAGALQSTLGSTYNTASSQHDTPRESANITLLMHLAHAGQGASAAHPPPDEQPSSPGRGGSKDSTAAGQQCQSDSLLSQLQLLLQLQQQLQQQPRQPSSSTHAAGYPHPGGPSAEGQEATDSTLSDVGALLQQQLEHASRELPPNATPKMLLSQVPDLQRVPPPLQLELPSQAPSSSAPTASALPQTAASPTQQLVHMLLALQSTQAAGSSAGLADSPAPQQQVPPLQPAAAATPTDPAASTSNTDGGEDEQQLAASAPDAAAQKAKARLSALPAFTTEAQLLQLLDRVGLQPPLDTRALLQAAGLQPSAAVGPSTQAQPSSAGPAAATPPDDSTHMAVTTLCSLSSTGQQAAAALAAASAVAADAAAVAAAAPAAQTTPPAVSPSAHAHPDANTSKASPAHKPAGQGAAATGELQDDEGSSVGSEGRVAPAADAPPAAQSSPPAPGVPGAEPDYMGMPAELPTQGIPVTSSVAAHAAAMPGTGMPPSSFPPSSVPNPSATSAPLPAHAVPGLAAGGMDPSVMAAALDQSVLPLLQQIAPFGVQQLTQEQREQAERMLLSLLPLLPLTPSDGSQAELDPESAAVVAAAAAAAASDPGHRLVPTAGGASLYSMYDPRASQLQLSHDMQSPGSGALSTVVAGRGRKDQGPKRLLDFRLHVPHKFVESHFPEQSFPMHTTADVYVNGELVKEGAAVKLYATRNNTRKTGIGNFWLTGLQQTIKLYKDVKVNSISVADNIEGQVKKFVLHLSAQGVWHEPPAFVKRGLGQTGDTTGNPAVKPYDGRIHVPLALMKQHFAGVEVFPLMATADMYMNGELMVEATPVRVVRYQKHKREGHYNYWITGHQKLVRQCNDLRVLCVEFLPEGKFKICFVAPQ